MYYCYEVQESQCKSENSFQHSSKILVETHDFALSTHQTEKQFIIVRQTNFKNSLTVPHLPLALSAKSLCDSAPTVWNSLADNCKEAELVSTQ